MKSSNLIGPLPSNNSSPLLHLTYAHTHTINRYSYFTFNENEAKFASASDEDIAVLLKHHELVVDNTLHAG